jgi:serine/threonine-protein kinase
MLGTLLAGRYQVRQILGRGGFGQTYIALDTHRPGDPKCVVKHFHPVTYNPGFMETARRLFNSEAEILEKLGYHDQIPRLLAYFEENREFFLVQEFIEGHSLKLEMPPEQPWSEGKVILFLQQVLDILKFIHLHNVIHRDIKPDNIIRRSQDGKLVLIDFGSVKQVQTKIVTLSEQTEITVAIGTPGYMPIEQVMGKPHPNSDIYSLGIVAIQALTGLHPREFEVNAYPGEIVWQHRAKVSPEFANLLSKMVLNNCKERYQTAIEVLEDLQQNFHPQAETQSTITSTPTQPPEIVLAQQEVTEINNSSILSREKYKALEHLFLRFVGPIAQTLLRRAVSAQSYQELIDNLIVHVAQFQQTQFKHEAMLLLDESTIPTATTPTQNLSPKVQQVIPSDIDDAFVVQCERELIDLIGPIARLLIQKAIKTSNLAISREEFVKILAAQVPDAQKAIQFQQHLLS